MRAYSVENVLNARFNTLNFEGKWLNAVGKPELTGSWFVYGPPKNGKTTLSMMLAKYMTEFGRVFYNSIEEGLSLSVQMAFERVNMSEVSGKIVLGETPVEELIEKLSKKKSAKIIFFDSIQFAGLKFSEYKIIKETFPHKLFVYVSHIEGRQPQGETAKRIWRDANVVFRVEGHRAFPVSRYGGGGFIDIWEEEARRYWIKSQFD